MGFPATRLSLVARTRSVDADTRQLAFASLIDAYWKPVYKYLRLKWQLGSDDAADLTQEFFTSALEKDVLGRFDPRRARFRTYLRVCLDGFVSNVRKAEGRLKRGGGVRIVPLDFSSAENELGRYEPAVPADVDELFYQEWMRALFQRAVDDLRASCTTSHRALMFRVFERYDLAEVERPTYAAVGAALGLTAASVTNHLAAMRRELRRHLLDRLRELSSSEEEFETEARRLFGEGT